MLFQTPSGIRKHLAFCSGILFSILMSGSVDALTLKQCDSKRIASHGFVSDHRKHGNGLVSYKVSDLGYGVHSGAIMIESCGAATAVAVSSSLNNLQTGERFERDDQAWSIFNAGHASKQNFSLSGLQKEFEKCGFAAKVVSMESESCACAAAHPFRRGAKQKFHGGWQ